MKTTRNPFGLTYVRIPRRTLHGVSGCIGGVLVMRYHKRDS